MATTGALLQGMRGKLGTMVLRDKVGGGTVAANLPRKTNANTAAQQEVRARFKLMSQLASQMKRLIAIPRDGALTSRNQFVKINYPFVQSSTDSAEIALDLVQLTKSNIRPGNFTVNVHEDGNATISFVNAPDLDHVVYVCMKVDGTSVSPVFTEVVDKSSVNDTFLIETDPFNVESIIKNNDCLFYAYGWKDKTEEAATKYAQMNISTADQVAQVVINRTLGTSAMRLSTTAGLYNEAGDGGGTSTNG